MAIEKFERWKSYRHKYFIDVYFTVIKENRRFYYDKDGEYTELRVLWCTNQGTNIAIDYIVVDKEDRDDYSEIIPKG